MFNTLSATNLFDTLKAMIFPPAVDLPEDFPRQEWEAWRAVCRERWRFFSGEYWEQKTQAGRSQTDKYPLRINPIRNFALKHAYVLFGETPDAGVSLVKTRVVPGSDKDVAMAAENALDRIYYENNMRALMMENGVLAQFLGGCVFKVGPCAYNPLMPSGVRIERVIPDYFWAEPDGSDMWNLKQAWIIEPITVGLARSKYNVKLNMLAQDEQEVFRVEHWTREAYRVSIEGQTAMYKAGDEWVPIAGENKYKLVPIVYFPHERAGSFHGMSHVESISAVAEEYNSRVADAGDAVREESRQDTWFANVTTNLRYQEISAGRMAMNLGMTPPGGDEPKIGTLNKPRISSEMTGFLDGLYDQMRRDGFVPPVADGEDEGSQRSALTLAFRMWPLTSHIRSERQFWTVGLNILSELILIVLAERNQSRLMGERVPEETASIGQKHLGLVKQQKWYAMIPRDREQLVNELILRAGAHHVSPKTAIAEYGDVDDVESELRDIVTWLETLAASQTAPGGEGAAEEVADETSVTDIKKPVAATITE